MILTDFYRFECVGVKAKHRMDCTLSTRSYPGFEDRRMTKARKESEKYDAINVGDLVIYFVAPDSHMSAGRKRKADRSITIKSNNLSSIYNWQRADDCWLAYGDFKGTADALLFVYRVTEIDGAIQPGSFIEIFIARGKSNDCISLCNLYSEGELDEEISALREQAEKHFKEP